jgi:hypothetical protein
MVLTRLNRAGAKNAKVSAKFALSARGLPLGFVLSGDPGISKLHHDLSNFRTCLLQIWRRLPLDVNFIILSDIFLMLAPCLPLKFLALKAGTRGSPMINYLNLHP